MEERVAVVVVGGAAITPDFEAVGYPLIPSPL